MLDSLPLSRKQIRSIADATARINIWHGAIRSGKTIASLVAFLIAVAAAPSSGLIVIVGRSLQTIERNVLDPLQDASLFGPIAAHVVHTRGATTATILGRTVHLIGAADSRAEGRLRGLTACLAYVDEATLIPRGFWNQLLGRLSVPGARLMATTNPDNPGHWLRKDFLNRAGALDLRSWQFTLDDNPALDPAYVAALRAEYVGLWHRRFILGHWVQSEGAIYEMFDTEKHVVTELPSMTRWLCDAIDYGTVNPFVSLLIGLGADGRLYVASEYRHDSRTARRQLTDAEYSAARRRWLATAGVRPEWTIVDPSASSFIEQLHRDQVSSVMPADNTVLDGIRTIASLFAADKLRIHRSCTGLIDELPGYSWDDEKAEKGEDAPIKLDDHSCDALRYGVRTTEALWRPHIPTLLEVAA
ncbi:PBSX family phage terminase large subunit [Streptomyces jumonjinensis]|uniref:PBSX family phage terminase large subunit n=1 Tax=Streptomyces jumonjinensis TaxID=1945 RepID=A0A646KPQ2_STRJU|nr:PBSX family phage terminase large subunit [Streptomyces jumonjinensis]MQT03871.1 PBSX family phage terminase large subunit [Streptomyces jumonjinensis]